MRKARRRFLDVGVGELPYDEKITDAIDIEDLRSEWAGTSEVDPKDVNFVLGDARSLPYDDEIFAQVHAGGILGPYVDMEVGLSEIYRVTKPGGAIKLRTWGRYIPLLRSLAGPMGFKVTLVERAWTDDMYGDDEVFVRLRKFKGYS